MSDKINNHAYIDGANLHMGVKGLGWIRNKKAPNEDKTSLGSFS